MTFHISTDVGGTFTDLVVSDDKGEVSVSKSLTTPADPSQGIFDCLALAADYYQLPLNELLGQCTVFIHGTTISTNAMIQGTTAKTGLICTEGFRDILTHREGGKKEMVNLREPYAPPYIPRYLTLPVKERVNSEGGIEIPLDEDDVRKAVRQFREWNVEAIAVCLLWSIANPIHERRIGEILKEEWRGSFVLSHELNPILREYRRTISTCIDASVRPIMREYITTLDKRLRKNGYQGELYMLSSTGGMLTASEMADKPITSIGCGPAMIPVLGVFLCQTEAKEGNFLAVDMGGTSFDATAVRDGRILVSKEAMVGDDLLGISKVDVSSIGAGGGSIAWVDPAGLLHVGPGSAGADPGPACYGRGGEEPTVTDADLILGYFNPEYFLGGRLSLDPGLAEKALEKKIARPLNLNLVQASFSIYSIVNQNMVNGIKEITVSQGVDPRESLLISGGGAAGAHCACIARELGMKEIIIPRSAGAFSALGGLHSDIIGEFTASFYTDSSSFDCEGVNRVLQGLEEKARGFLSKAEIEPEKATLEYFMEARYGYQVWEIETLLRVNRFTPELIPQLVEDFHATHERIYSVKDPMQYIECILWIVRAKGQTIHPKIGEQAYAGEDASSAYKGRRKAYYGDTNGFLDTPIYEASKLLHGNKLIGPAIIEEPTTTIVIPPGAEVTISKFGNYLLEFQGSK